MSSPALDRPTALPRDWWTVVGIVVVGLAAVVASFSALSGLAVMAGWSRPLALLLPVTIDAYGLTAVRLRSWVASPSARRRADMNAAVSIGVSIVGNVAYHAVQAQALTLGNHRWLFVVAVGMVPPLALGALAHLASLASREQAAHPGAVPSLDARAQASADSVPDIEREEIQIGLEVPVVGYVPDRVPPGRRGEPGTAPADPLLTRAAEVFADHLEHGRRPSIRAIRSALQIGQPRAQEIQAHLIALVEG